MFFQQIQSKKTALFFIISFAIWHFSFAQEQIYYEDKIYSDNIKTVKLYKAEDPLSYPVIMLNTDEHLILEFDDFSDKTKNYTYSYIHCNPDWESSNLFESEFIDGFHENEILDYSFSFNTLKDYNHYKLRFPQTDSKPYLSGNYILFVYEDYDKDKPVLTRRFRIAEQKTKINADIKRSLMVAGADCCVEFTVRVQEMHGAVISDTDASSLHILKNNSDLHALKNLKPNFIKGTVLEYNNPRSLFMPGGNEYRYFNVKNRRKQTDRVAGIGFIHPYYIFALYPDRASPHIYSNIRDINGQFLIRSDDTDYPDTEAEYVLVDFTLPADVPFMNGDVHVYGNFTDRRIAESNKMEYNPNRKAYERRMMIKQGFYNYFYVLHNPLSGVISIQETEGNFYQTENDYLFYFYYKSPGDTYYQLIGHETVNSQKKI